MSYDPTLIRTAVPADDLLTEATKVNRAFNEIAASLDDLSVGAAGFDFARSELTGGLDALDGIDGSALSGGETAVVMLGTSHARVYFYRLDANNSQAESSPYVIAPDVNAGTKRWLLAAWVPRHWISGSNPTVSDDQTIGVVQGDTWQVGSRIWRCVSAGTGAAAWAERLSLGTGVENAAPGNHGHSAYAPAAALAYHTEATAPHSGHATVDALAAHTGAGAPHSGHVQVGGQLGGSAGSPDVRGLRETGGPTLLTMGLVGDGEIFKRQGSTVVGLGYIKYHYARSNDWTHGGSGTAALRRTVISPDELEVRIDTQSLKRTSSLSLDVNADASWDFGQNMAPRANSTAYALGAFVRPATPNNYVYKCTTAGTSASSAPTWGTTPGGTTSDGTAVWTCYRDDATASQRAGVDYYIYECQPTSGTAPDLRISRNSTVPHGYTSTNSRKVSGFHCLCVSVGTISGHTLTGFLQGDVLPQSIWDLKFRAHSENEGMVFDPNLGMWVDIYLQSGTGSSTASAYGATITDTRTWMDHVDDGSVVKKRLLRDHEFQILAEGSNQETNISGAADPVTTGGHSDTASRRMISNIGCEDCCGAMWQWLDEQSYRSDGTGWAWIDISSKGSVYVQGTYGDVKMLAGGCWTNSSNCGSYSRYAEVWPWITSINMATGTRFATRSRTV